MRNLPQARPSIGGTSALNSGSPNTIYQETAPGELTPFAYDLLLWDSQGEPLKEVSIAGVSGDNLPEPDGLAEEIIENLEAGLNCFREILGALEDKAA